VHDLRSAVSEDNPMDISLETLEYRIMNSEYRLGSALGAMIPLGGFGLCSAQASVHSTDPETP
jgi:hypothetical protein